MLGARSGRESSTALAACSLVLTEGLCFTAGQGEATVY
jgi:hypothetical protein